MSEKPTKTTNRIHFSDLDPLRFEDLCLSLAYRLKRWKRINHIGREGSDGGVDIQAEEEIENGYSRNWFIQCKRYEKFSNTNVDSVIETILNNYNVPDTLFLIVGCDVSKKTTDYFMTTANKAGIKNPVLWTASILEAELFYKHHDLLFIFFGIDMNQEEHKKEESIRRNIKLKKNMIKDLTKPIDLNKKGWTCTDKFKDSNFIIHSIDDTFYPDFDDREYGISTWFKVEPFDFYYNGIEIILSVEYAEYLDFEECRILTYDEYKEESDSQDIIKVFKIGRIPFSMIVDYDIEGDEYYPYPHIYCNFGFNGQPYESFIYRVIVEDDSCHHYPEIKAINR